MTELLLEIQRSKKFGDLKYQAEYTDGGFIAYVTIPIDLNGKTTEFMSDKKVSMFEATENVARTAIDTSTSTYKLNIVDYTSEALDKLSKKYMAIELRNTLLEEANRVLLKSLTDAQDDNGRYRKEIADMKMQCRNEAGFGVGGILMPMKIKDEKEEFSERVERNNSTVSKKLMF